MIHPYRPNAVLRLTLTGVGSVITVAAAATVWVQLSLRNLAGAPMGLSSGARLRRGRVG